MNTKKEICAFSNALMSVPNGEELILDSFAAMYINLKKAKNVDCKNYQILNDFFKKLNIFPQMDDKGNISYEKREKKEVRKEDNINSNSKQFFKRRQLNNKGEKVLINDILFNLKDEIDGVIYISNNL